MISRFKKNPLVHLSITMWKYAEGRRLKVLLYATMAFSAIGVHLCEPLLVAQFIRSLQELRGEELVSQSAFYLCMFFLLSVGFWALHGPSRLLENSVAFWVKAKCRSILFQRVTLLPMKWHKDNHSGEIIDQVDKAVTALGDFTEAGFMVIHMLTRFLGAMVILAFYMPSAAAAVAIITIAVVTVIVLFDKVLIRQHNGLNTQFNKLAAKVQDFLTNVGTVISLRLEDHTLQEVIEHNRRIYPAARKNFQTDELKWFVTAMLIRAMQTGVLFAYIFLMIRDQKQIEIATFYALFEYLRTIGGSFFEFTWQYGELVKKSTRLKAIEHIDQEFLKLANRSPDARLPIDWRRIDVKNLCFSHDSHDANNGHLHGIDFKLRRGWMIALVGSSGCGKSTTLALLRGLHISNRATVLCDENRLSGLGAVAQHCTLIPQEPEIFAGTIRFNITLGRTANDKTIREVIELAQFAGVLKKLPKGLETDIAEKGVNLSGGEKQRLALARGLFFAQDSKSEIILLDEPTSSVDPVNERKIYQQIRLRFNDRCVASSLHKLNLLDLFDEVLVFDAGKLVESGSPTELKAKDGALAKMLGQMHAKQPITMKVV